MDACGRQGGDVTSAREIVTLAAALGCGVIAGVLFAFSTFEMNALARLAPAEGIAAMQAINRTAISPLFMLALFGTALACVGLGVWAILAWGEPGSGWTLAAAALYLAGSIAVTVGANVRSVVDRVEPRPNCRGARRGSAPHRRARRRDLVLRPWATKNTGRSRQRERFVRVSSCRRALGAFLAIFGRRLVVDEPAAVAHVAPVVPNPWDDAEEWE
jgi:uncharacterized membrane protein